METTKTHPILNARSSNLLQILGPGLLYAGAAVGVSHLVQSTRAGAEFGPWLIWAVLAANILKYPFFEAGPRYAAATGESLLEGYAKVGRWAIALFVLQTLATMFIVIAAVTIVTAGLATEITGLTWPAWVWSSVLLLICLTVLGLGRYSVLDNLMKAIIVILSITTILALFFSFGTSVEKTADAMTQFDWVNNAHIAFLIALLGWMPAPIDIGIWHSVWTLAKKKDSGREISLKESLLDFKIGYWGTTVLALCFLGLGAMVLYGTGKELPASGGKFAREIIGIYTESIGNWAYWLIGIAAFTTMFSTTLTCLDAYPRVLRRASRQVMNEQQAERRSRSTYWIFILIVAIGAVMMIAFYAKNMKAMVDIATTISFLTAPVLAIMNHLVIHSKHMPEQAKPPKTTSILSYIGIAFLVGFSIFYVTTLFR